MTANVNRVTVKTPPFWKGDPNIWFAEIEAQFTLGGITNYTTKYYHVISAVDTEILTQVSDIIQRTTETNKYDTLKSRLVNIYTVNEETKLRKVRSRTWGQKTIDTIKRNATPGRNSTSGVQNY